MTDILDAIAAAVGCQHCEGPLGDSPSDDFCTDLCQEAWHAAHGDRLLGYREPWDRPWDFPGIGTDFHSTGASRYFLGDEPGVATPRSQRGHPADLVIIDEVHTWVARQRPEFRLPRSTGNLAADHRAALAARRAATTDAQRAAVELRFVSLRERATVELRFESRVVFESLAAGVARFADQLTLAMAPAIQNMAVLLQGFAPDPEPQPEEPPAPHEVALTARRTRNTGPAARGRPPRTIGQPSTMRPR